MSFDVSFRKISNAEPIVDLELAKLNSHIDDSDQDVLLTSKLKGAIAAAESYTERTYQPKNVTIKLPEFSKKIQLPVTPLKELLSISYVDVVGDTQVINTGDYKLFSYQNGSNQRIVFSTEVSAIALNADDDYPVIIKGVFGEEEVPDDVVSAILLLFSESEMFRENRPQKITNSAAINLLRPYRKM